MKNNNKGQRPNTQNTQTLLKKEEKRNMRTQSDKSLALDTHTHTGKFVRRENLDENCSEKIQLQREKEESNKERKKRNIFIHVRGAAHTRNKETNRRKEQRKRKQNHNNNAPLTQERT